MAILGLQSPAGLVTLKGVKQWQAIALVGVLAAGVGYVVTHRLQLGLTSLPATGQSAKGSDDARDTIEPPSPTPHPANIEWQKVDRSADGFKVEMPTDVKEILIPAYNETGETDKVNMIFSNPDTETTYSVAWEDNPPVARVSKEVPDRTLDSARDGAVTRTRTTLVNESTTSTQGFPGREFMARNSGGGILNSRLIYAGPRLYMLTAVFPSVSARRDTDVSRFFNSFVVTGASGKGDTAPNVQKKAG
ncbi:MAG: hypothetical protein ACLPY1_19940 [Terracidiphilus sp.]